MILIVLVLAGGTWFAFREGSAGKPVPATGAERLAVPEAERIQRAREAETARLNGLAGYYNAKQAREVERMERIRQTEIERWNAIAEDFYARQTQEAQETR
jgi:hypothetical protein